MKNPCKMCYLKQFCLKEIETGIIDNWKLIISCKKYRKYISESKRNYENSIEFFSNYIKESKEYDEIIKLLEKFEGQIDIIFNNKPKSFFSYKKGSKEMYRSYERFYLNKNEKSTNQIFGEGTIYHKRNLVIVDILKNLQGDLKIFEFASTFGFLALEICNNIEFKKYKTTNFLDEVVNYIKTQGLEDHGISIELFDANDILKTNLKEYNTFVCTSFEHLEKDIDIIKNLPNECTLIFSVTNFNDPTHFRIFRNKDEIKNRYKEILDIIEIKIVEQKNIRKFVINSRKKSYE